MDNSNSLLMSQTRSTMDFQGMGELRSLAARDSEAALRQAAQQFEAMFLQMMLKSMREATIRSDMFESPAMQQFEAMHDRELALHLSSTAGGFGLAEMLVTQLKAQEYSPPTERSELRLPGEEARGATPKKLREAQRAYTLAEPAQELTLRPVFNAPGSPLSPSSQSQSDDEAADKGERR